MEISKIVITGGPCAGKSSALQRIRRVFTPMGYTVLFISETATELISGGVAPWTCSTPAHYQQLQLQLQLEKERVFEQAAQSMAAEKVLIVCDRGTLDSKAYMTEAEFAEAAALVNQSEDALRNRYDAVFHLITAAKGADGFYTTENNAARTETPEQAAVLDDRLLAAWAAHPRFCVIDSHSSLEEKIDALIAEIAAFLTTR